MNGEFSDQVKAIVNKLSEIGGGVRRFLSALVFKFNNIYTISVDYGMSIEELVRLGYYDWLDRNITSEHFPTSRTGKAEIAVELIHFDRIINSNEALRELDKMGYRPAELHELLVFGAKYPNVQRKFIIVALGSVWQNPYDCRHVAYLDRYGSKRLLDLHLFGHVWWLCRFAAVRK